MRRRKRPNISAGKIWAGWIEAEKPVEDDLELVFSEGRLHVFDAVIGDSNMWMGGVQVFIYILYLVCK
jgi:hypothetical protein